MLQLTEEEQRRYARQIGPGVLTPEGQLRLKQSRALVTRAGGMGGPWGIVLGSLAAMAILVALLWNPASRRGEQADLVLYCAAGALRPVEELCAQYEQEYGVKVRIEPGGSGTLLSKIRVTPAAADLYLAADDAYQREARAFELVAEILPVAKQHPVIAVRRGNALKVASPADLARPGVRVALPNPQLAACGKAAERALAGTGQWEAILRRSREAGAEVSLVGTVNEAAQAVKLGAADAAVVWDATARQFEIQFVEVPEFQEKTADQVTLGVTAATPRPTAALHFARYLTAKDRGQIIFQKYYYQPLEDADAWEDRPELVLMSGAMLKPAIEELLKRFEEREGVRINTAYAGCGILVAQMKAIQGGQSAGKSFPDAYFSCDVSFMRMVQDWFEASTCISRNDMVLAVARNSRHKHLMRRLLDAILSPESREHFQDVGFHWVAGGEQE